MDVFIHSGFEESRVAGLGEDSVECFDDPGALVSR